MALCAILLLEHLPARKRGPRKTAVGVSVGAIAEGHERTDICREGIEVGADASLGIAQRLRTRARMEICIAHEARAECEAANLAFEIVYFIEVAGPMQRPM